MAALDLTKLELSTALQACRAMAYQEGERAKQMGNPAMRETFEQTSRRYAELARKFETALEGAQARKDLPSASAETSDWSSVRGAEFVLDHRKHMDLLLDRRPT